MLISEPREYSERQSAVLDVIEAVFLREGLRPIRISQLTEAAHCSRSTLYELAPSKEGLFLLVLDRLIRRIRLRSQAAMASAAGPVEALGAAVSELGAGLAVPSAEFLQAVRDYPPARLLYDQHALEAGANLRRLVREAIEIGAFRPVAPDVVSEVLLAVVDRFIDPEFTLIAEHDVGEGLEAFFDMLVHGLAADASLQCGAGGQPAGTRDPVARLS